jgi:hypothetical protein
MPNEAHDGSGPQAALISGLRHGCASLRPKSAVCLFRQYGLSESQGGVPELSTGKVFRNWEAGEAAFACRKADTAQAEGQKGKVLGV